MGEHRYELLNGFLKEMTDLFPDEYIHLGGDEVVFGCWFDDPNIARWAASKGFRNGNQIEEVRPSPPPPRERKKERKKGRLLW
jgi:hexosaminidase